MSFIIIAALDEQRGIGLKGKLPWRLKGDLEHFRKLTVGDFEKGTINAVIMGKTTWLSLPEKFRPLPKRLNIVLTHDPTFEVPAGVVVAHGLHEALEKASATGAHETFVIGGAKVYAEAIQHPACTTLYITEIGRTFACDAFFPEIPGVFKEVERSETMEENGIHYQFVTYKRKS